MLVESSSFYTCGWLLVSAYLATVTFITNRFHQRPLSIVECIFISIPTSLLVIYCTSYALVSIFLSKASFALHLICIGFSIFVYRNILEFLYHLQIETRSRVRTSSKGGNEKLTLNPSRDTFDVTPFYVLLASFLFYTCTFSTTHLVQTSDGSLLTRLVAYPDMFYRISMINSISEGINSHFDPTVRFEHPFIDSPQTTPVITEFISVMLLETGLSLRASILLPSVIMASSFSSLLYIFNKRFTGSRSAALLSIVLVFLCNEPLTFATSKWPEHLRGYWSDLWQLHIAPLQEACFIYPIFLIACILLHALHTAPSDMPMVQRKRLLGLAGLFSMFTYPHHSYIAIICISFTLAAFNVKRMIKDFRHFWHWFGYYLPTLFPVLLHYVVLPYDRFLMRTWEFDWKKIEFIWRAEGWYDPLSFWIRHLGLFVFASFFFYAFSLSTRQKTFYSGFLAAFLVANLYHTQVRGIRHNFQVLYCWHFAAAGVVALGMSRLWKSQIKALRLVMILLILTFVANGLYQRITYNDEMTVLYSGSQRQLAAQLGRQLPLDIGVLSNSDVSPTICFMGRKQVIYEDKQHQSLFKEWAADRGLTGHLNSAINKYNSLMEGENYGVSMLDTHHLLRVVMADLPLTPSVDPTDARTYLVSLLRTVGQLAYTHNTITVWELDQSKVKDYASGKIQTVY